jgi:hypothetical protein
MQDPREITGLSFLASGLQDVAGFLGYQSYQLRNGTVKAHKMLLFRTLSHHMLDAGSQNFPCFPIQSHAPSLHGDAMGSDRQGQPKTPNKA